MEFGKLKSVMDKLHKYTYTNDKEEYIQVTEWENGEGWDIDINGKQYIHLSFGELEAIKYLIKSLDYLWKEKCELE